jgi:hypothetical protein
MMRVRVRAASESRHDDNIRSSVRSTYIVQHDTNVQLASAGRSFPLCLIRTYPAHSFRDYLSVGEFEPSKMSFIISRIVRRIPISGTWGIFWLPQKLANSASC